MGSDSAEKSVERGPLRLARDVRAAEVAGREIQDRRSSEAAYGSRHTSSGIDAFVPMVAVMHACIGS